MSESLLVSFLFGRQCGAEYFKPLERSCSIGINRFWFDGLIVFFRVLLGKTCFGWFG